MSIINSNSLSISPVQSSTDLTALKQAYLQTLSAPLDGYWETAIIGLAPHYEICHHDKVIGYCVITETQQLLQLYVNNEFAAYLAFEQLVASGQVKTAVVGTNDNFSLATCINRAAHFSTKDINTYLFQDATRPKLAKPVPNAAFRLAVLADLETLVAFYGRNNESEDTDAIETGFGNQLKYVQSLIENKQVFLLTNEQEIFGIGECRLSQTQPAYADVGMIVDNAYRRQNIGTYILLQLKQHCYANGRQPICSCTAENIASRKTIEKAGFISNNQLLNVLF